MREEYYAKEFKALNRSRIKYLVIGGLAVNLYGLHRMTRDLDLIIDLSRDNFDKLVAVLDKIGYKTKAPKSKWDKLTAISFFTQEDEDKQIDVFLKNPLDFSKAYRKRKVFKGGGVQIPCVSLADLIDLKNKAGRVRDWVDVGSLKRMLEMKKK